ncbi:NAD(P)/FAD-dependent oxidoreductase [Salicola sp. Rm-C-2C1-2]|uniref:NAD(P)/FAD-dependent oxidoreductase n=1 Tax=Salicola sp. Rm-C-2C1-2 TaxID=3141321 RepID=UPI0032E4002E
MPTSYDVIIIGAGAAGLMCAATAGYRGRRVLVIEHARRPGRKILMSGGGRCNFTNLNSTPANFLSDNPGFCISALKRYTPDHFLELVERHGIEHEEKAAGQLFCQDSSREIVDLLMTEAQWAGVEVMTRTTVETVATQNGGYTLSTSAGQFHSQALVVACGGLSIPTMGATGFGYELARQFGLPVIPTQAGLVPFTLTPNLKTQLAPLAGISCPVAVSCNGEQFREPMLVTHKGLSGPAMLQISSFWRPGEALTIDLLPDRDAAQWLADQRQQHPNRGIGRALSEALPKRFAQAFADLQGWQEPLQHFSKSELASTAETLNDWQLTPAGTEGYRTAEVTLGGVDTQALSSKTMEVHDRPGLFFIGEVVDVTGHLGGHNFQWAWASGVAAGQAV